jgi:hypothetical protein
LGDAQPYGDSTPTSRGDCLVAQPTPLLLYDVGTPSNWSRNFARPRRPVWRGWPPHVRDHEFSPRRKSPIRAPSHTRIGPSLAKPSISTSATLKCGLVVGRTRPQWWSGRSWHESPGSLMFSSPTFVAPMTPVCRCHTLTGRCTASGVHASSLSAWAWLIRASPNATRLLRVRVIASLTAQGERRGRTQCRTRTQSDTGESPVAAQSAERAPRGESGPIPSVLELVSDWPKASDFMW